MMIVFLFGTKFHALPYLEISRITFLFYYLLIKVIFLSRPLLNSLACAVIIVNVVGLLKSCGPGKSMAAHL